MTRIKFTSLNALTVAVSLMASVLLTSGLLCAPAEAAQMTTTERANKKLDSASESVQKHQYHRAFKQIHRLAKQGHPTAQHLLGMMYENGVGVEKNLSKAVSYYEKSAQQNFGDAQCALGRMYHEGNDVVVRDAEKARDWLTKAAEKNVPEAEYKLGLMHASGDGVPQDMEKAGQYLQRASAHGVDAAKDALAKLPNIPNYQGGAGSNSVGSASPSLGSLQQAWGGYGTMVQTLKGANSNL